MKHGIDLSFANGNPDFGMLKAYGKADWVTSRASYGSDPRFDDGPIFARNHDQCKLLSIPFGAYHFVRFADDATAQANHFLSAIDGREGQIVPMLDVEEDSCSGMESVAKALDDLATINSIVTSKLARPLIYTNYDTWVNLLGNPDSFSGHGLWLASSLVALPFGGWKTYTIWQYGIGSMPGITGQVDLDVLCGDDLELIER